MHGKGDHVAGLRAWLTCRTDGLVGALPAQQSFLFSTVLAGVSAPVGSFCRADDPARDVPLSALLAPIATARNG